MDAFHFKSAGAKRWSPSSRFPSLLNVAICSMENGGIADRPAVRAAAVLLNRAVPQRRTVGGD
jgi:hypothetical protein